jgi:hypothetical protein
MNTITHLPHSHRHVEITHFAITFLTDDTTRSTATATSITTAAAAAKTTAIVLAPIFTLIVYRPSILHSACANARRSRAPRT